MSGYFSRAMRRANRERMVESYVPGSDFEAHVSRFGYSEDYAREIFRAAGVHLPRKVAEIGESAVAVLEFIKSYVNQNGFPPTRSEISNHFGYKSANAAEDHLRNLARRGLVKLTPGVSRGIRVLA